MLKYHFKFKRRDMNAWIMLIICIGLEALATSLLKLSDGFTKPIYAALSLAMFAFIFYLLSIIFRTIPMGVAYAVWSGVGIVLISLIGYFFMAQKLDTPALVGIALIVAGTIIINAFSKSVSH